MEVLFPSDWIYWDVMAFGKHETGGLDSRTTKTAVYEKDLACQNENSIKKDK